MSDGEYIANVIIRIDAPDRETFEAALAAGDWDDLEVVAVTEP